MIVYGNRTETICPRESIRGLAERCAKGDTLRNLLIDFGILEAGVADAVCPTADTETPLTKALRQASLVLARFFLSGSRHRGSACVGRTLDSLGRLEMPPAVRVSLPEGYTYYGLYPEAYADSARRFERDERPSEAVVIGIRSIGTSLSAVVSAALTDAVSQGGCYTVRPQGHPFDRQLTISEELKSEWRSRSGGHFLIVDEGPGLSGSSFACVARALSELGIPDSRIVLFPSWLPDASSLLSADARERWARHPKYAPQFDPRSVLGGKRLRDLSAGRWRSLYYRRLEHAPAVQPQHERVKYFCAGERLWKFEGLGEFGKRKLERAWALAAQGFSPRPFAFEEGFLSMEFPEGTPCRPGTANTELLEAIARYTACLHRETGCARPPDFTALLEMILVNTSEGLSPQWASRAERLSGSEKTICNTSVVQVDGRMLPHEWLLTARGYLKTDSLDHHDDHFFPGCQDIAWDLAGASVEFEMSPEAERFLLERFASESGDTEASARLAFYRAAYLAYRMGYTKLAAETMGESPDAAKFRRMSAGYAARLKREIAA